MTAPPEPTASLCPHCLRRIPARRITEGGAVYLEKSCPEHGDLERVLVWNEFPRPFREWARGRHTVASGSETCPGDCGLCPEHRQQTCTAILEVTGRCNLRCPYCFAAAGGAPDPEPEQIAAMLQAVRDSAGLCPLQLSGGEPTLRDDLPRIVAAARELGFDHVQINTNGIRLAEDEAYGRALVDAGATAVYLQFDGVTAAVQERMRGADLLPLKRKALENCARWKIGVILVPTIVKNVNDGQVGDIIRFAKRWMPTVKGVHFQPAAFLGRYPAAPRNEERFLLSDLLAALETQTHGELRVENLIPAG